MEKQSAVYTSRYISRKSSSIVQFFEIIECMVDVLESYVKVVNVLKAM